MITAKEASIMVSTGLQDHIDKRNVDYEYLKERVYEGIKLRANKAIRRYTIHIPVLQYYCITPLTDELVAGGYTVIIDSQPASTETILTISW